MKLKFKYHDFIELNYVNLLLDLIETNLIKRILLNSNFIKKLFNLIQIFVF